MMIELQTIIHQFDEKGEKTGWTYLDIPQAIATELKPDCKVSFRIKGKIDNTLVKGIALAPMGGGDFILPLKKAIQKQIGKGKGAIVNLLIEEDKDFKLEMPEDLNVCLSDLEGSMEQFNAMPKSHQNYYFNWINAAKTELTRVKRIAQTVDAMEKKIDFGEMIRYNKAKK
ncbi:YdeI/OmpD-associated family protein [Pedobacter arcticus]|uniref:YdeI/OmpD-associated family protein n=1 Tax=Pedobacter arcticus TaxID=752140 RepID=UPI0002E64E65|nr:YdeI/OmpD-associated family protein [Pedobacter arcticus]